jgi:hypothetical protein
MYPKLPDGKTGFQSSLDGSKLIHHLVAVNPLPRIGYCVILMPVVSRGIASALRKGHEAKPHG